MNDSFSPRCAAVELVESAYHHVDTPCDNFAKTSSVVSDLLYGAREDAIQPWISVIIPTFMRSDLLKEAIESVLLQEKVEFPWEVLVVDNSPLDENGSTPALDILRENAYPKVLYFHNRQNIGSGYNWNRGVELARGEWVTFLHDDDVMYPDALRHIQRIILAHSEQHKKLGYIHARRDCFSKSEELKNHCRRNVRYYEELTRFRTLIMGETGTGMPSCGTTIRKQAYVEVGGINHDFGLTADAVLGYQIMKNYKVIVSDFSLGAYRWSDNETLKIESLQNLIHADFLFAQYRYSQAAFARLWGKLFWKSELNENIRYKIETGKKKEFSLTPEALCQGIPYERVSLFLLFLYRVLRKLYVIFHIAASKLQSKRSIPSVDSN